MVYFGEYLNEISFPVGGIGTGCFGVAGNGRLVDWEIFNRPGKGKKMGYTHIAVKAKTENGKVFFKVLNSDLEKDLMGTYDRGQFHGYGYGPSGETMSGLPHFKESEFDGEFPIAKLTFRDKDFPGTVVLTVFNPFIPLDSYNSSLPAGFFDIEFINNTDEKVEYSAYLSVNNPFKKSVNELVECNGKTVLKLGTDIDKNSTDYGDLSIACCEKNASFQCYWYRGGWKDSIDVFVKELQCDKMLDRVYDTAGDGDTATVKSVVEAEKNDRQNIRFVLSWNVPNNYNYWTDDENKKQSWKNYYATVFGSSAESAVYCADNFQSLYERTLSFKNALFDTTVDKTVTEAISATMSVIKTSTVLRLEDGSFYGWEGVHELAGSCEGTCQHVWNYAYALCFLFPDLERSIRDNEFKYSMCDSGKTVFRMSLPLGSEKLNMRACLDGQMGIVFKTYREWKISGNTAWLKSVWDNVKKVLSYAWSEENEDKWDFDKDGVLEGRQHHTLDMEIFGASAWLEGMYLCALKAGTEMARFLGDSEAEKEYGELFKKGYEWTRENLFNGEYFIQKIDLNDKSYIEKFDCPVYWYDEAGELKYQIASGCEIDQLLGQWHSDILGLGEIFSRSQMKTALKSIYKYNFVSMRDVVNTWRVFSLNDEKGAIICSFPQGKHTIPIPYQTETMTGFEYALAGLMIAEGMEKEGLEIVKSIRARYDGKKRNPWNEIECGSNYARAMASYALIPIYSGFKFDLPNKQIGFDPIHKENFKTFFSVGTAWGVFNWKKDKISLEITEGALELNSFIIEADIKKAFADGKEIEFSCENAVVKFDEAVIKESLIFEINS